VDQLLAAARFVHYAATLQLFGVTVFYVVLMPAQSRPALERPLRAIAIGSAAVTLVSGVLWLLATAAGMGSGPSDAINPTVVGTVLTRTGFGQVWGPRLLLAAAALGLTFVPGLVAWRSALLVSVAVLGSLGLVGHAATGTGLILLVNETSQVLHVLSSGFWIGALLPLLFLLRLFRDDAHAPHADAALRRFSGLGHIAVALLVGTGVLNTWLILGSRLEWGSLYVQLLGIKVAIAGGMVVLALVNRYVFMPRIPHGGPGATQLARGTVAEFVLSAAILGLVSIIGMISPH
jgi:copper resistance protein D